MARTLAALPPAGVRDRALLAAHRGARARRARRSRSSPSRSLPRSCPRGWARWVAVGRRDGRRGLARVRGEDVGAPAVRDERVLAPLGDAVGAGLGDFYRVLLPFDPGASPEMHGLMLIGDLRLRPRRRAPRRRRRARSRAAAVDGRRRRLAGDARRRRLGRASARSRSPPRSRSRSSCASARAVRSLAGRSRPPRSSSSAPRGRPRRRRSPARPRSNWESWDLYGVPHARDGRQVRVGLELRGHQLPAHERPSC